MAVFTNLTGRHGCFFKKNRQGDMTVFFYSTRRHGPKKIVTCDMETFLKSTCNMVKNKQQKHATLAFLKIDMRHGTMKIVICNIYGLS